MTELTYHDLQFALLRCPKRLLEIMKRPEWAGRIFVGGGFLRSIVAGEEVNDIDIFVTDKQDAEVLSGHLAVGTDGKIYRTENAHTLLGLTPHLQIIHRWTFGSAEEVCQSFDFTCCCAMFWWNGTEWRSTCDPRFYCDVAAKRLIYRNPVRNEDAGGSMLRVLKYYQKGYRIPLDSLADVITRLVKAVDFSGCNVEELRFGPDRMCFSDPNAPKYFSQIICGLLREVDPQVDPNHVAHLPAEAEQKNSLPAESVRSSAGGIDLSKLTTLG